MVYLRPDTGHGDAVLAHGTITSSLRACADLALAADAVPETNGAILGTRCEVGIIACLGLGAPPEAKPAIANLRSSTPALGRFMVSALEDAAEIDEDKLHQFVFRAVDDVGATLNAAVIVTGDYLGLYRALAGAGPLAATVLAQRTGTAERYIHEWLNAKAAGGYVEYDPGSGRYTLPPEQVMALTDPDSPAYLPTNTRPVATNGATRSRACSPVPIARRRRDRTEPRCQLRLVFWLPSQHRVRCPA